MIATNCVCPELIGVGCVICKPSPSADPPAKDKAVRRRVEMWRGGLGVAYPLPVFRFPVPH
jgi:hypothetical protein